MKVLCHCFQTSYLLLCCLVNAIYFPNIYPGLKLDAKLSRVAGDPLLVTPYLRKDSVYLAQNLSRVHFTEKIGCRSYSGFLTICDKFKSNLFFWYFPPFSQVESSPVILWLQGGPGGSSLFGLFTEIGPVTVKKSEFALRKYHWALDYHLIFIDNPVGTGFSYTKSSHGYCNDENCVADGLYTALQQFFDLFPKLRSNDLYIAGESYAGKYIPSLAMVINKKNAKAVLNRNINLKGLAMGNAYCDPINQIDYGNYLFQIGLIDDNQLKVFLKFQKDIGELIKVQKWEEADLLMSRLMNGEASYFKSCTGFVYYYNFLRTKSMAHMKKFSNLLQRDDIRRSIHIGGLPFNDGENVQLHLAFDVMKSVAPLIEELLGHYPVMFYNGQLDIVVAYPLTEHVLHRLNFTGSYEYRTAPRHIWKVGNEIAGYVKLGGNLTDVLVRNAGHMVPMDQPKWALDMIRRFINRKFWFD